MMSADKNVQSMSMLMGLMSKDKLDFVITKKRGEILFFASIFSLD